MFYLVTMMILYKSISCFGSSPLIPVQCGTFTHTCVPLSPHPLSASPVFSALTLAAIQWPLPFLSGMKKAGNLHDKKHNYSQICKLQFVDIFFQTLYIR